MPLKKARYRFRRISPTYKQRLAFVNGQVVEVVGYFKKNRKFVRQYKRRLPRRRKK